MFDRLSRSFDLVKASATVLREQRQLLLFPIISGFAVIFIAATFIIPLLISGGLIHERGGFASLGYAVTFLAYVVNYFVVFYFNTALVACVMLHYEGRTPTLSDGFAAANGRFGAILGYAVISATVGVLLRAIQERVPFVGRIVVALIGAGWTIASFLVVPVLVVRNTGPLDAIRESATLVKRTWGENLIGNASIGLAFGIINMAIVVVGALATAVLSTMNLVVLVIPVIILTVLAVLAAMVIHTALSGIYAASLYRFATATGDGSSGILADDALRSAFLSK
jgi:hypothetical protein